MTVSAVRSFRRMRTGFRCRKRMLQKYVVALCLEKNLDDIGCISASHSVIFMQLWPKRNRLLTAATFDSSQVAMTWPQFIALRYGVSAAFLPGAERRARKRNFHFQCSGLFRFVRKFTQYLQHLQTTPETRNWCVGGMGTLPAGFTALCASVTKSCSFMVCYQFLVLTCLFWFSFSFSRPFHCFCINESMLHLTCWPYYIY